MRRLDCYRAGWIHSDRRLAAAPEWPEERIPSALRLDDDDADDVDDVGADAGGGAAPPTTEELAAAERLDAGDMGCGELVLLLRRRLNAMPEAALLHLVARDPGAPEDLPAWCRLTGHRLRAAHHPVYVIERRPDK